MGTYPDWPAASSSARRFSPAAALIIGMCAVLTGPPALAQFEALEASQSGTIDVDQRPRVARPEWPPLADGVVTADGRPGSADSAAGARMGFPGPSWVDADPDQGEVAASAERKALTALADELYRSEIRAASGNPAAEKSLGGVVAIVHNGISVTRGYGCLDASQGITISEDGSNAVFRLASVSKVITATAAMQLVGTKKLALDEDVNTYLEDDLKFPPSAYGPITLRNLLTHTAGIEENQTGYVSHRQAEDVPSLHDTLLHNPPRRIWPPTKELRDLRHAAYSGWGMSLVGHIVARQGGYGSFEEYVENRIFGPLQMSSSSFREPGVPRGNGLPSDLQEKLATGHVLSPLHGPTARQGRADAATAPTPCQPNPHGRFTRESFEFFNATAPAGGMTSSAADMANFMIAHLDGVYDGKTLMDADALALMHGRALAPFECAKGRPCVNGSALGFYEMYRNGVRGLTHRGATLRTGAKMLLLPEQRAGIFIAVNTRVSPVALRNFMKTFVDYLSPAPTRFFDVEAYEGDVSPFVGQYASNSHSYSRAEKAFLLASPGYTIDVQRADAHTLRIVNMTSDPTYFVQVGPRTFQHVLVGADGKRSLAQERVAFELADGGRASHLITPMAFDVAYRVPWYERPSFHTAVTALALLGCLMVLVLMIMQPASGTGPSRRVRASAMLLCALTFLCMSVACWAVHSAFANPAAQAYGYTFLARLGVVMNDLVVILGVAATLLWTGTRAGRSLPGTDRIMLAVLASLQIAFVASMATWNLVGLEVWR